MKHLNKLIILTILFTLIACSSQTSVNFPVKVLNSKLKQEMENYETSFLQKRTLLTVQKGESIEEVLDCKTLKLQLKNGYVISEQLANQQIASDYQVCFQLSLLKTALPSKKTFLKPPYETLILEFLDLQSFLSSLKQQLEDGPQTLSNLGFNKIEQDNNQVRIETDDWYYQFNIIAKADFNHDGTEDLLIEFIDQAKQGNYFSHETIIVKREEISGYLTGIAKNGAF